ncbi:MAG: MarR family transcriptional regulator [Nocardioidaceae bacterium]
MTPAKSDAPPVRDDDTLLQASKVISAAVAHSLAAVDEQVSVPGLRVLVMLHDQGAMNLTGVAEGLGVNASSASRTCDRLVLAKLLDRRDAASDRRHVALTLTPRGRRFVEDVLAERQAVLASVVDAMPPAAQKSLMAGLKAFVSAAESKSDNPDLADSTGLLLRWVV